MHFPVITYICALLQEGKTVKSSSGFLGKGFKFDETEAQLANERKKLQKAALGLQDSDDEDSGVDVRRQTPPHTDPPHRHTQCTHCIPNNSIFWLIVI